MSLTLAGIDIGGTKCAVCLGEAADKDEPPRVIARQQFPTPKGPEAALEAIQQALEELIAAQASGGIAAIGVSCGGPLDSHRGLLFSPPNLPGWDRVEVTTPLSRHFGVPVALENDANACALAEWRWGAGRGCHSMIFLTFGTGMGAGLILDGKLYAGANDQAGEVGHLRLAEAGPEGYGKAGSFEGFCSGGGIARLAQAEARKCLEAGQPCGFCSRVEDLPYVTAERVAIAAQQGDPLALEIFQSTGRRLGQGLAILVDLLNPERIIIGSIYTRQRSLLEPAALEALRQEALPLSLSACHILPAGLGESLGDLAGLSVAWQALAG